MHLPYDDVIIHDAGMVVWRIVATADGLAHWLFTADHGGALKLSEVGDVTWCTRRDFAKLFLASPVTCLRCARR